MIGSFGSEQKSEHFILVSAELGYRGAGRTLTEKEYLEEVERIEMAKKLKEINENAEQVRFGKYSLRVSEPIL